jgi:V-type H+-transporting ATPase subunit C
MPSDQSTWIISVPQDGDSEGLLEELGSKISQQSKAFTPNNMGQLPIPSFKVPYPPIVVLIPFVLTR